MLADGSQMRYGPCTKPVAIQRALNVLFAALNKASVNREVVVPDVVGDSVPKGWVLVATAGLAPTISPAAARMSARVVEQDPPAGTHVRFNAVVSLTVRG